MFLPPVAFNPVLPPRLCHPDAQCRHRWPNLPPSFVRSKGQRLKFLKAPNLEFNQSGILPRKDKLLMCRVLMLRSRRVRTSELAARSEVAAHTAALKRPDPRARPERSVGELWSVWTDRGPACLSSSSFVTFCPVRTKKLRGSSSGVSRIINKLQLSLSHVVFSDSEKSSILRAVICFAD